MAESYASILSQVTDAPRETLTPSDSPTPYGHLDDRQLSEAILVKLDHLDPMVHRLDQLARRVEPLLERWGSFLGSPVRDFRAARKSARRGGDGGG
jgi:hypothetical protein